MKVPAKFVPSDVLNWSRARNQPADSKKLQSTSTRVRSLQRLKNRKINFLQLRIGYLGGKGQQQFRQTKIS